MGLNVKNNSVVVLGVRCVRGRLGSRGSGGGDLLHGTVEAGARNVFHGVELSAAGACCVLRVARCVLRVTCYVLRVARCALRVTCYVLRVTCYVLRVTCHVLRVASNRTTRHMQRHSTQSHTQIG